jgi:hypothetical protein
MNTSELLSGTIISFPLIFRLNLQGCKLRARNYCMFEKSIDIGPKNSTIDIFDGDDSFR